MAGGVLPLRKLQLGQETTAGTAVAADFIWRGKASTIEDRFQPIFVDEQIGYLSGTDRTYVPFVEAALSMEATEATFEQLPHILEAGVKTATPVQDGAGTDYIYTYAFPTTAKNTIKTYTIEGGDDQQEEEFAHAFVEKFVISGKGKEALMMSADWLGRQVAPSTFTALSAPTVETILFQKGKLYIDAIGGTIGTTQVTSTLLGMDLSITTGWHTKYTADGNLYFTYLDCTMPEVLLNMTWVHNATAVTEKANWRAQTARLVQVKFEGTAVATPGTTYSVKTLIGNLAGKWDRFEKIGEQDGNDIVNGIFRARYNSTASLFASILVINELSALP